MGWHDPHCQGCEVSRSEASAATSGPALSCCSMPRWHSDSQLPSVSAFAEGLQGHGVPGHSHMAWLCTVLAGDLGNATGSFGRRPGVMDPYPGYPARHSPKPASYSPA